MQKHSLTYIKILQLAFYSVLFKKVKHAAFFLSFYIQLESECGEFSLLKPWHWSVKMTKKFKVFQFTVFSTTRLEKIVWHSSSLTKENINFPHWNPPVSTCLRSALKTVKECGSLLKFENKAPERHKLHLSNAFCFCCCCCWCCC